MRQWKLTQYRTKIANLHLKPVADKKIPTCKITMNKFKSMKIRQSTRCIRCKMNKMSCVSFMCGSIGNQFSKPRVRQLSSVADGARERSNDFMSPNAMKSKTIINGCALKHTPTSPSTLSCCKCLILTASRTNAWLICRVGCSRNIFTATLRCRDEPPGDDQAIDRSS